MHSRTNPLLAALLLISAVQVWPVVSWADEVVEAPPAAADASIRILGSAQGERGVHAFLLRRADSKMSVMLGKAGALRSLEVLAIERGKNTFVLDTLEAGRVVFDLRDGSVILPGDIGFVQRHPTVVLSQSADPRVVAELQEQLGKAAAPEAPVAPAVAPAAAAPAAVAPAARIAPTAPTAPTAPFVFVDAATRFKPLSAGVTPQPTLGGAGHRSQAAAHKRSGPRRSARAR
jgi:hypothetical protein